MKVLVVFDSVSATKMTAKVANTIAGAMKNQGVEADCFLYKDVSPAAVKSYDCLIVGSPTMALKPTKEIMQFLEALGIGSSAGKLAAAFDTQIQMRISGNATKTLESKLNELGFKLLSPPLIAYVEGKTDRYRKKEGELEKARVWATELANSLVKVTK
jgi:flavodoxin